MLTTANESYLRDVLFNAFKTLNTFSGIEFIEEATADSCGNVSYPNKPFDKPEGTWFELDVLTDEPESVGLFKESQNRWTGFLQITLHVPLDAGTDQADNVYYWLNKLFAKGSEFAEVSINGIYKASEQYEADNYKTVFRVEFDADID